LVCLPWVVVGVFASAPASQGCCRKKGAGLVGLLWFCVVCVVGSLFFCVGREGEVVVTVVCYVLFVAAVVFGCGLWSSYLGRVFFAGTVPRSSLLTLLGCVVCAGCFRFW
jgi:hypothetical protein